MLWHDKLYRLQHGYQKGLLGGITDAIGLTDYEGAEDAQKKAVQVQEKAAGESLQIARENIAFQKEQYTNWYNVFGDLSENIKEYYDSTSAKNLSAQRIAAFNTELQKTEKDVTKALSQRGIATSGLTAQALTSLNYQGAQERARIRATAEEEDINKKLGFLSLGLGQGSAYAGIVNSASNTGAQSALSGGQLYGDALTNYGNTLYTQSSDTESALKDLGVGAMKAGASGGSLMSSIGSMGSFLGFSDTRLKDNITLIGTHSGFNVYSWTWNEKAINLGIQDTPTFGLLAQEIQETNPEAIVQDSSGYLKIDYSKLRGSNG